MVQSFFEPIKIGACCCWCPGVLVLCCWCRGAGSRVSSGAGVTAAGIVPQPVTLMGKRANRLPPPNEHSHSRWPIWISDGQPVSPRLRRPLARNGQNFPAGEKRKRPGQPRGGRSGSSPPPTPATATHTQYPLGCVCRYWLLRWVRLFYMAVS